MCQRTSPKNVLLVSTVDPHRRGCISVSSLVFLCLRFCADVSGRPGAMEGSFGMVPGTVTSPSGPVFRATVATFPLRAPDMVF